MRVLAVEISCHTAWTIVRRRILRRQRSTNHFFFLGGGEVVVEMSKIFGLRLRDILKRKQKAVLLCSMNIARTLKVILKYGHRPGFQVL